MRIPAPMRVTTQHSTAADRRVRSFDLPRGRPMRPTTHSAPHVARACRRPLRGWLNAHSPPPRRRVCASPPATRPTSAPPMSHLVRMRVVVSGATGVIGRKLVGALIARGDEVVALSRDERRARDALGDAVKTDAWPRPTEEPPPDSALAGADAVVNL